MKKHIQRYFERRNYDLNTSIASSQRSFFGDREIQTFLNLYTLSYSRDFDFAQKAIVDLGAGDKFIQNPLEVRGAKYLPLDIDDIDFNVDKFPFENESIDAVISLAVIEHIENVDNYLNEIMRVLVKGGIVYLTTPNFKYCYKEFYNDPTHVKPFTEISLERLMEMYSFSEISVYPGLRCKPDYMYTRHNAFEKAAKIPFVNNISFLPEWIHGRATSVALFAVK